MLPLIENQGEPSSTPARTKLPLFHLYDHRYLGEYVAGCRLFFYFARKILVLGTGQKIHPAKNIQFSSLKRGEAGG